MDRLRRSRLTPEKLEALRAKERESKRVWYASLSENEKNYFREKARSRELTDEQKKRHNAYTVIWARENPEKRSAAVRKFKQLHPEKLKQFTDNWRAHNREKVKSSKREWAKKNPLKVKAWMRRWIKENPEKHKLNNHRRRARKNGSEGSYAEYEWLDLVQRCNHRCLCCGRQEPEIKLTVDHIVPLVKGGSNWIRNIQPLCFSCNCSKGSKTVSYL